MVEKSTIPKLVLVGAVVGLIWYAVTGKKPEPVKKVIDVAEKVVDVPISVIEDIKKVVGKTVKKKKAKKKAKKKK